MTEPIPHRVERVTLARDVVVQVIGAEALVLNLRDETIFSLNPTGARIAELISKTQSLDEVVDTLCLEYGAERHEIARDVYELVEALLSIGLIVPAPGEGPA